MTMMGYEEFNTIYNQDNLTCPKLRPLMPWPTPSPPTPHPPCFLIHASPRRFLGFNHHTAAMVENKREVSTRWNPTPEQLQTLEELYRRGIRTPNSDQIQQITTQLRGYGKIEGKNVFYWFQNHKARDRQKRRRRQIVQNNNNNNEKGLNRTAAFEVEKTKNWASPTNSSAIAEKTTQERGTKCADQTEFKSDRCVQFDDAAAELILHHRRNATWHLSCSSSPSSSPTTTNQIANSFSNYSATPQSDVTTSTTIQSAMLLKQRHHDMVSFEPYDPRNLDRSSSAAQTLQLFPLQSGHGGNQEYNMSEEEGESDNHFTSAYQFFEFFPVKNLSM